MCSSDLESVAADGDTKQDVSADAEGADDVADTERRVIPVEKSEQAEIDASVVCEAETASETGQADDVPSGESVVQARPQETEKASAKKPRTARKRSADGTGSERDSDDGKTENGDK